MSALSQTKWTLNRLRDCNPERRGEVMLDCVTRIRAEAVKEANGMLHMADEIVTALTAERDALKLKLRIDAAVEFAKSSIPSEPVILIIPNSMRAKAHTDAPV